MRGIRHWESSRATWAASTRRWLASFLPLLLVLACTSTADLRAEAPDKGSSRDFQYPVATLLPALKSALGNVDVQVERVESQQDGSEVVYGESGPFMTRQGEVLRIWMKPLPEGGTRLYLISRKKMSTNTDEMPQEEYAVRVYEQMSIDLKRASLGRRNYGAAAITSDAVYPFRR